MLPKIIGITGKARAGKDTIAEIIAKYVGEEDVLITGFAYPFKVFCKEIFSWTDEHLFGKLKDEIDPNWGVSPREVLQTIGSDWGRVLNEDIWVRYGMQKAFDAIERGKLKLVGKGGMAGNVAWKFKKMVIFTDVRFPNEAKAIKELGDNGRVIKVFRPNKEIKEGSKHTSETSMDSKEMNKYIDTYIYNKGTVNVLRDDIHCLLKTWDDKE